jgi:dethiobiotin synthetase
MGRRILIAGDKSHAGKSTISLGLLGALLEAGYKPSDIAYVKPATQCVSSTLTARFCEARGIDFVHIGPVVFYRGFTRACLDAAAEAEASGGVASDGSDLVAECKAAVDRISDKKLITIIDGVGYPSVGSIVGCSSADLAVACAAPVLLVGKSGVGDAVDSFNL